MPEFQEKAVLLRRERIAPAILRLTLHAPNIVKQASPGQFVMLRIARTLDPLLRRPFSIHQVQTDGSLQVLFKVVGHGTELLSHCQIDDVLDCIGPLGHGFSLPDTTGGPCCLVGGGMGIAPLYFLAGWLRKNKQGNPDDKVLLGGRTKEEVAIFAEEFATLGFQVHVATDDGSMGHHGLVPELLPAFLHNRYQVYTCGPMLMMKTVADMALAADSPCQVSLETHMACGLGACLGCAVPAAGGLAGYVHVCRQGPVFEAREVAWPV